MPDYTGIANEASLAEYLPALLGVCIAQEVLKNSYSTLFFLMVNPSKTIQRLIFSIINNHKIMKIVDKEIVSIITKKKA